MTKGKIKLKPTFKSKKAERNCRFCITFWCMFVMFLSINSLADEMVHKFKSPSFNGIGTSSHYLTRIEYTSDGIIITLKITDPDGNVTEISLPIGSFTF